MPIFDRGVIMRTLCALILLSTAVKCHADIPQTMSTATEQDINGMKECVPNAQAGYHHAKGADRKNPSKCLVIIHRTDPVTPGTFTVSVGTQVYVELVDTRPNENVTFGLTATKALPPDVGSTAGKNLLPGLQSIVASQVITPRIAAQEKTFTDNFWSEDSPPPPIVKSLAQSITERQMEIAKSTDIVLRNEQIAAAAMTCLSSYQALIHNKGPKNKPESPDTYGCSQATMLDRPSYQAAKDDALAKVEASKSSTLRLLDIGDLDQVVKSFYLTCLAQYPQMAREGEDKPRAQCRRLGEELATQEALLDTAITDIPKAQDTLFQSVQTLTFWPGAPEKIIFKFTAKKLVNMSIVISGVEVVSKTASPIATININVQQTNFVVSTGISFSNLKYHTYMISPVIVAGQPVLDGGKTTTVVTQNAQSPSIAAPLGLVSYRLTKLSRFEWQNKCPGACSFLVSAGIGADLTSKSADIDIGPSLQIGGVLFTPTVHFGRDTRLTNGVAVGQLLGTSPPSSVPTTNSWVTKYGFAITYTIPITPITP